MSFDRRAENGSGRSARRRIRVGPTPVLLLGGIIAVAGAPAAPASLRAQSVTVDEGVFDLRVDGEPAGTERFTIRRTGSGPGARIIAQATVRLDLPDGRQEMVLALEAAASSLRPEAYQIKISGVRRVEITGRLVGRRFSAKVVSERGEEAREYRASPDALIIDREIAHQYYFLARRLRGDSVSAPVIVPRRGEQITMDVAVVGRETLSIGGAAVETRRLRVSGVEGEMRHVWVDGAGKVIRVEIPVLDYRAERREPPA